MQKLIDYADPISPVPPSTSGAEVYARFEAEPETFAIAVVDDQMRPIGLIDRGAFFLRMAAEFGRALYASRPATFIMSPPRIERADASVLDYLGSVITERRAALLDGFVVVDPAGRYLAIGTALSLIETGYRATKARVRHLAAKSEQLAKAEQAALAGSRAKSQFLAIMSHEIRTPLNGVLGVAQIVDQRLTQSELRPYIRTILDSGELLHRLLTDALDLSRAEFGAMELTPEPVSLGRLVEDLKHLWRPAAEQKGLGLRVHLDGEREASALVDPVRLKQVLNNLIGNALKFTPSGEVVLSCRVQPCEDKLQLSVTVNDTGVGIAHDQLQRIFEPFAKTNEHRGGAGLGLSICREIVAAMGGRLRATSTVGEGSQFEFAVDLPRAPDHVPEPAMVIPAEVAVTSGKILVVDDNEVNRLVACTFLEMFGLETITAEDGVEAVDRSGVERFDLILMDVKMPRMDGAEATRQIRSVGNPNRDTPIIAVTANADVQDAAEYRAAGMNGTLRKPLTAEALLQAVSAALNRGEACEAEAA